VLRLLNRRLTSLESALISVGGLIGAGLFVGSGTAILAAGPPIILSYAVAGLMLLAILRLIGQMRRRMPDALFITDFVHAGLGNLVGRIAGRIYCIFWALVVTIEALAGANILAPWGGLAGLLAAIGLLAATVAIGERLSAALAEWEVGFAGVKVAVVVAFIALTVFDLSASSFSRSWPGPGLGMAVSALAGLATAFFSLAGAEIVHTVTNSPSCARQAAARAIGLMSIRVFGIYFVSVALILATLRWSTIRPGFSPFTLVLERLAHPQAARFLSAVILIGVLTTLNTAIAISSRLLQAAGRDGRPLDALRISPRIMTGAIALTLLCAAAYWPAGAYRYLVTGASVLLVIVYLLFIVATDRLVTGSPNSALRADVTPRWIRRALIAALASGLLSLAWIPQSQASLCSALCLVMLIILMEVSARFRAPRSAG
jgi:GABA permease